MRKRQFELVDRPIAFQRSFVRLTGSVTAALMLSQAVYWSDRTSDEEGWFYKSQKDWEEETGLSRWEQDSARKTLRSKGFWHEKLKGMPAIVHFRVDCEVLQSSLLENHILVCGKTSSMMEEKPHTSLQDSAYSLGTDAAVSNTLTIKKLPSETTTETTTEITQRGPREFSTPEFEQFWKAYPYQIDKREAIREWYHVPFADQNLGAILAGLEVWKVSEQWQEQRFVPSPAKFLRMRRWESKPPGKIKKGLTLTEQLRLLEAKSGTKLT